MAERLPDWLEPMAATLTEERSLGPGWLYERKFDGIRLLAYKQGNTVELFSRNRLPQHLPSVAAAVAQLPVKDAILDGEVAWDGKSDYPIEAMAEAQGRVFAGAEFHALPKLRAHWVRPKIVVQDFARFPARHARAYLRRGPPPGLARNLQERKA